MTYPGLNAKDAKNWERRRSGVPLCVELIAEAAADLPRRPLLCVYLKFGSLRYVHGAQED